MHEKAALFWQNTAHFKSFHHTTNYNVLLICSAELQERQKLCKTLNNFKYQFPFSDLKISEIVFMNILILLGQTPRPLYAGH